MRTLTIAGEIFTENDIGHWTWIMDGIDMGGILEEDVIDALKQGGYTFSQIREHFPMYGFSS